jgi:crossover junction endodeoxyribonuclease RuvC
MTPLTAAGRRVLGIDPSLSSTGLAVIHHGSDTVAVDHISTTGHRDATITDRVERITRITKGVAEWLTPHYVQLAVIEGPSLGSRGGSPWDRAGLWWAIVEHTLAAGIPLAIAAPSTRAKWATGSGGADKVAVAAAMQRRYPDVELGNSDEADALALATMGAQHLGWTKSTAAQRTTLAKVSWPEAVAAA